MRILCMVMSFWNNPPQALSKEKTLYGWYDQIQPLFHPVHKFIVSGTRSDPKLNPLAWLKVDVVNAGVESDRAYDILNWNYCMCAFQAGFSYALNRNDWDLLVLMDDELLIGDVNFDSLLKEFIARPELVLANQWAGTFCGSFSVYKREALVHYLYKAQRLPALGPRDQLVEHEFGEIFNGKWWNPWKHIESMRQDFGYDPQAASRNEQVFSWPFIRMPHPDIVQRYKEECSSKAVPVR